jgi:hypothetical protein
MMQAVFLAIVVVSDDVRWTLVFLGAIIVLVENLG